MSQKAVLRQKTTICNNRGLHARAAARLAKLAETFDATLTLKANGLSVSAHSIMGLMLLADAAGTVVEVEAAGEGAQEGLDALVDLIEAGFEEDE